MEFRGWGCPRLTGVAPRINENSRERKEKVWSTEMHPKPVSLLYSEGIRKLFKSLLGLINNFLELYRGRRQENESIIKHCGKCDKMIKLNHQE